MAVPSTGSKPATIKIAELPLLRVEFLQVCVESGGFSRSTVYIRQALVGVLYWQ
jgi:hypothetical protein